MTKSTTTKDNNNDAAAAAPDASAATTNLDDFTMDIEKFTDEFSEGKSPDSEAAATNNADADDDASDADGTTAGKGDDDGEEASADGNDDAVGDVAEGATDNDAENPTSEDSDDGVDKDGSDDGVEEEEAASSKASEEEDEEEDEATDDDSGAKVKSESDGGDEAVSTRNEENSDEVHEENGSEGEEPEELWDLKMVLPVEQIRKSTNRCGTAGCDLIPCCIWSSSNDPETPWYCCLDCQARDFDGWPEKKEDLPIKVLKDDLREAMLDKCTRHGDLVMPDLPSGTAASGEEATTEEDKSSDDAADVDSSNNEEGDGEEMWELKKVFSVKELKKSKPTMCSHCGTDEECDLVACSVWVSSLDGNWFSCLDHQENDYSGWPTEEKELPMKFLTEENRQVIAEKCSAQENPAMPSNLPTSMPLLVTAAAADKDGNFSAITPPPSHNNAVADGQANVVVGAGRAKGGKKKKGVVTPMPPGAATKKPAVVAKKPSAAMMQKLTETRQRWQADAERLGGPDARIVVSKPEAKKLIFQMLLDNFRPMNTNGAFQALKGIVPPPTLRTCLDDMVDKFTGNPFADDDSDDEDGKSSKKKNTKKSGDEWAGSLRLKEGRNLNNNLYYVDHKKLANNGNGMIPEVRNDLLSNLQGAKAEFDQLSLTLKKITAEAAQLVSEPKNEELTLEGADLEKKMREMKDSLEAASAHSSNEARSKQIKKGIENMGKTWRKRKRQCIEFISMMDESTEGAISLKKCLNGACPLDIESDDACIKATIAFASRKRPRVSLAGRGGLKGGTKGSELGGLRPDENFVGVKLGSSNKIIRIFAEL